MTAPRPALRRCPSCGSRLRGRGARCGVCGAAVPWHLAPGRVLWGSAAIAAVSVLLIGGLLWWRSSDRGPRPADEARLAGVLSAPPTAPATFTAAPPATATRPPNSPFPPTATPLPAMIDYVVQSGDTMYAIAFKYNVTLDDILAANTETLQDVNSLSLGQVLRVPLRGQGGEPAPVADSEGADPQDEPGDEAEAPVAEAEQGDALPEGEPEEDAAAEEQVAAGEPIVVQEALTYAVDRGDTLGRIAAEYGVAVDELVRINEFSGPNEVLSIGQDIVVAPAVVETTTPAPTAIATPLIFTAADDPGAPASLPREDAIGPPLMAAPLPLAPGHTARIGALAVTLRWASAGALPADAYYVVALRLPDEPETETRYEWLRGGGNASQVPATLRPAPGAERAIEWAVTVRRERGGLLADDAGLLISESPLWRRFTWAPGEDGSAAEATQPPPVATSTAEGASDESPGDGESVNEATPTGG